MNNFNVIRFEKIKTEGHAKKAQGHNFRLHKNMKNVDLKKTQENVFLVGDGTEDFNFLFNALKEKYGFKYIKNEYVMMNEFIVSASPDFFKNKSRTEINNYFKHNLEILTKHFFKVEDAILSAVIHYDETTPHLHVVAVPLVETEKTIKRGKDEGKTIKKIVLSHDQILGDREKCRNLQNVFHSELIKYGYDVKRGLRNTGIKHKKLKDYNKQIRAIKVNFNNLENDIVAIEKSVREFKALNPLKKVLKINDLSQMLLSNLKRLIKMLKAQNSFNFDMERLKSDNKRFKQRLDKINDKHQLNLKNATETLSDALKHKKTENEQLKELLLKVSEQNKQLYEQNTQLNQYVEEQNTQLNQHIEKQKKQIERLTEKLNNIKNIIENDEVLKLRLKKIINENSEKTHKIV